MVDHWLDVTTIASNYEVEFSPVSMKYRHRLRHLIHPATDPSIIIVRSVGGGEWMDGKPPRRT